MLIGAKRIARHHHQLLADEARDLADDVLQHGETQREDDGIGALQSVAIARGDGGSGTDVGRQQSYRSRRRRSRAATSHRLRQAVGRQRIRFPRCR